MIFSSYYIGLKQFDKKLYLSNLLISQIFINHSINIRIITLIQKNTFIFFVSLYLEDESSFVLLSLKVLPSSLLFDFSIDFGDIFSYPFLLISEHGPKVVFDKGLTVFKLSSRCICAHSSNIE